VQHGVLFHACAPEFVLCSYLGKKPPFSGSSIKEHSK
jgi:hypothetical protein